MSTEARLALDHQAAPWLLGVVLATILPHFLHQPLWLSAFVLAALAAAAWLWWKDLRPPGNTTLFLLVICACAGIWLEYRTLLGREAGVALLVIMMSLKQLELRSLRDALVVVVLGYFLLLTHYFHAQDIPTGLWLLASLWLITATLVRLYGGPQAPRQVWRHAGSLCLQAIPFLVILYLLFPRISGPLWGMPRDAHSARTGLSDSMSPGSISNLVQNGEIAFRARFDGPPPNKNKLYWRGPVFDELNAGSWRSSLSPLPLELVADGPVISYEMTLEAHHQRWLLALDAPLSIPPDAAVDGSLTVKSKNTAETLQRYRLSAALDYRHNLREATRVLRHNLRLPDHENPQARALGERWRSEYQKPEKIVEQALKLFNRDFFYTLRPPLLGQNAIDGFLFNTRKGFCEHYASAFVFLMRAAGVPARIVTGYQGGELNPLDGYFVIRQSDAHAWAEIWLAGRGWQRVDPTAAVAPDRIEQGIAEALTGTDALPGFLQFRSNWLLALRYRWEALNNAWNQHVLAYDQERQRELLSWLGWPAANWQILVTLLAGCCALALAAITAWAIYQRPEREAAVKLWYKALRHIARRQVNFAPWETPLVIGQRVGEQCPDLAIPFQRVVDTYLRARYGAGPDNLKDLRDAVAQLP